MNFKENLGSLCEYEVEEVGIGCVKGINKGERQK
jgi:hypothetical protein